MFRKIFEEFLTRNPDSSFEPAIRYLLAITHIQLFEYDAALSHLQKITQHPRRLYTFMDRAIYFEAYFRALLAGNPITLEEAFKLLVDPVARGWAYNALQNFEERLAAFQKKEIPVEGIPEEKGGCSISHPNSIPSPLQIFMRRR